ncbi:MAG: RecQ family ATP-dependent DNA helicase [Patescibacteria group bacterium]
MRTLLKKHFGFEEFRPLQEEIINHVMAQRDCLVLMPTGGGKSLCFQMPAVAVEGVTVVISPLISLMKDQVDQLRSNGIEAAFLNSTLTANQIEDIQEQTLHGHVKLLYVAPERLATSGFQEFLHSLPISLIAIDEAHCISEWGHDFRPEYRNLKKLRGDFADVPIIALTATATETVRADILKQLNLHEPKVFISSFNRPNLTYSVQPKQDTFGRLVKLLRHYQGESVIIYCFSRKGTEELAERLRSLKFSAAPYHAGLTSAVRQQTQEKFIRDEINIIIATIAFGMGIDKPDVRLVVHYDLPKSVEGYYQETGRAGRDGLPAECVLFFSYADKRKHAWFIEQMADQAERDKVWQQLNCVIKYAELQRCRRQFLLNYFGESYPSGKCASCDVCTHQTSDETVEEPAYDATLFNELKNLRKQLAEQLGVPPYIIFGNTSLQEMATYFPQSQTSFVQITGVGTKKLTQFGDSFLTVIKTYAQTHNLTEQPKPAKPPKEIFVFTGSTYDLTKQLLQQKLTIADIAKQREVAASTIVSHIEKLLIVDPQLDIAYLKPDGPRVATIIQAFKKIGGAMTLSPVRTLLGESYSYDELRLVRLFVK